MNDDNGSAGGRNRLPPVPRHRRLGSPAVISASLVVIVLLSLAFEPVRSAASDFLKVFRIQEVQTLALNAEDMQQISEGLSAGTGAVDLAALGGIEIEGEAQFQETSLADAALTVDFEILLPEGIESTPTILVRSAQTFRFRLDGTAVNDLLGAYGSERTLPAEIDGRDFTFESPATVTAEYNTVVGGRSVSLSVMQTRQPELVVPAGVDADELRDILVSLPFIPPDVRERLMAVDDWQNTFLLPVLGEEPGELTIEGAKVLVRSGPVLMDPDSPGAAQPGLDAYSSAVWNDDGVIRGIQGPVDESTIIALVESMIR